MPASCTCNLREMLEGELHQLIADANHEQWRRNRLKEWTGRRTNEGQSPPLPEVVVSNIIDGFPARAEEILKSLRWGLEGCWFFHYAGMLVGVEPDGYIHT